MNGLEETIGTNGFSMVFGSINHWPRWFFSLTTIGLDGFAMVFGLATIGLNGFSMVANHWSNDGMVTIHRSGLAPTQWMLILVMIIVVVVVCLFRTVLQGYLTIEWNRSHKRS